MRQATVVSTSWVHVACKSDTFCFWTRSKIAFSGTGIHQNQYLEVFKPPIVKDLEAVVPDLLRVQQQIRNYSFQVLHNLRLEHSRYWVWWIPVPEKAKLS